MFMDLMRMNKEDRDTVLEGLREKYTKGTVVVLEKMNDPYSKIPIGTEGVVSRVDDVGTIHVSWKNGSSLGVVYGEDIVSIKK